MSSFDIALIARELRSPLSGKRVDNVYQLDENLFLVKFTPDNVLLLVEPGRRIHTTRYLTKTPEKPTQLAMELRKHLRGLTVTGFRQVGFERVIEVEFGENENARKLIVELFPRGVLVVIDRQYRILAASSYARMRDRSILRGVEYAPAPISTLNPFTKTVPDDSLISSLGDLQLVRAVTRLYPVGGQYAEEALSRAGMSTDRPAHSLTGEEWNSVAETIRHMAVETIERPRPTVYFDDSGDPFEVTPIRFQTISATTVRDAASLDEALDDYFTKVSQTGAIGKRLAKIQNKRKEFERILQMQEKRRTELASGAARRRAAAEAVVSHLSTIQLAREQAWSLRDAGENKASVLKVLQDTLGAASPSIRIVDFDAKKSILTLDAAGLPVAIRRKDRPQDVVRTLYEQAKKSESKLRSLDEAIASTRSSLESLESRIEIEQSTETAPEKRRQKAWFEKFRWFRSSEGILVVAGRDASSNEALIKRHTTPEDIILHAEIQGAPFVVVKAEERHPTEATLREAAQAAVSYSRAWKAGLGSAEVYWVRADQLSKSPPPGEYLPKGAFVVRGKRTYLPSPETRLAIGVVVANDETTVVGGPPTAVRHSTDVFAIVQPGETPAMKVAAKLAAEFSRTIEQRAGKRVRLKAEDIAPFLPPGKSDISK